jgi:lambda repressor-like predicted transcriptional regulator
MSNLRAHPAPKPRISEKIRAAIDARVRQGMSVSAAAEAAGLSRNGLAKALRRPAVQEHEQAVREAFVAETLASRALVAARALQTAIDLLENAKSESVRARMVELLLSHLPDAPQSPSATAPRPTGAGGYTYARPTGE